MAVTYIPLATQTLSTTASSVTFSSIPATYTDLVLVMNYFSSASEYPMIQFNSDTATNYSFTEMYGNGTAAASLRQSNVAGIWVGYGAYSPAGNTNPGTIIINIQNYANTTTNKTTISRANSSNGVEATVGLWRNTAAINTIVLKHQTATTYAAGSTFNLYGIASAEVGTPKATGGDTIVTDGTYWYHAFRASGTFTPTQALTADYLVVAGGGGGGGNLGGGGGAGGLRSTVTATGGGGTLESALSLTAQAYTVTVGGGGAAGASNARGTNGSNSVFSSITSTGGGGGGSDASPIGLVGGSGGGGGTGAAGTTNQGYAGSSRTPSDGYAFGGGGGAGAVGGTTAIGVSGAGGVGVQITALATLTGTGDSGYYAGGGGGSYYNGSTQGISGVGGLGGGGRGGNNLSSTNVVVPTNALANTGGGGGGRGWLTSSNNVNGDGGSGLVVVRYAV